MTSARGAAPRQDGVTQWRLSGWAWRRTRTRPASYPDLRREGFA